jgi:hypothetical protein
VCGASDYSREPKARSTITGRNSMIASENHLRPLV